MAPYFYYYSSGLSGATLTALHISAERGGEFAFLAGPGHRRHLPQGLLWRVTPPAQYSIPVPLDDVSAG